jgi:hypothetical protein
LPRVQLLQLGVHSVFGFSGHSPPPLAADPDMAELLTDVTLRKASQSSVSPYIGDNVVKAIQLEHLSRLFISC